MSNFLNSGFTDLNCLTNIDSDEIRTNTLYVNGVQIVANSSNFSTINCQQLICQNDISANTIVAVTSIQNVPVAKYEFLLNVTSDIQAQFNNITTNFATKTQVTNNFNSYNTQVVNTYVTKTTYNAFVVTLQNTFPNYVLNTSLQTQLSDYALISSLSDYITNTELQTELNNYCLQSNYTTLKSQSDATTLLLTGGSWNSTYQYLDLSYNAHIYGILFVGPNNDLNVNSILTSLPSTYVSINSLTTTLSGYVTSSSLSSQLSGYVTSSSLSSQLLGYVTSSSLTSQLSNYCLQSDYTALKTQADGLSLLLSNTQYINGFGLNWYGSMNVFGSLIVTVNGNYLNVGTLLNSLPTTYATIVTLNQSLLNYVTNSSLNSTLSSYATNSSVDSKVNPVKSQADANSALIATNGTAIAGLITASAAQQTQLTGLAASVGIVQGGLTTAEGQITTLQAKTALQNVVGAYTQFTGGIKIMNGLVYTSIINNNGSSDFYGLMNLREGLTVTNGITSDRVTTSTELKSNGTLQVVGSSILSTTNITGDLTINGVPTQTPNVTTPSNLTITNGKLTISGSTANIFNNDCIFNGNITATNLSIVNGLSLTELNCNNLNFTNSVGNNGMNIGTNGGSFVSPNSIYIGNNFSTTYLNGLVIFSGLTFNMSSFINQVGF